MLAAVKHSRLPISPDRLEAIGASAVLWLAWLAGVIFSLGAPRKSRRLRRFVKRCERWVECITYLRARLRFGSAPHFHHAPRAAAAPGFRRQGGSKRLFMRCARIRAPRGASLRERVTRLLEALAYPEPYMARLLKRLAHGLHGARLVVCAPPAYALGADVPRAILTTDSS